MLRIRTDLPSNRISNPIMDIHVEETKFMVNGTTYDLDELKSRKDFRPFSRYIFPLSHIRNFPVVDIQEIVVDGETKVLAKLSALQHPFERYSVTYNTKLDRFPELSHLASYISMVFYPDTVNFKDALLIVTRQEPYVPLSITTTDSEGNVIPYVPDYEGPLPSNDHLMPKCLLSSDSEIVSATGTTLTFRYRNINSENVNVDFKATAKSDKGYVSHSKFDVVNGVGKFNFIPLGLSSGETVKVQVGIGKYTDICNMELIVE